MLLVNELFSGIGTQALALEYLGIPHKVVGISEIEKNALSVYNILHGPTFNYGDISKIDFLNYADLWTYSFPCFTGDSRVLTSTGYCRLDEIVCGMQVYTHTGNLQEVVRTFNNGRHFLSHVSILGLPLIRTTSNHKFLVLQNDLLEWVECQDISLGSYACILKSSLLSSPFPLPSTQSLEHLNAYKEYSDLYFFLPIVSIEHTSTLECVYDIEVSIDHSFTVEGVVVHNCQDLSSGGKGKGLSATDDLGNSIATRSGLLWEVERLLAKSCGFDIVSGCLHSNSSYVKNPPKYLLLENVPDLVDNTKHKRHFQKWLDRLDELGYCNSYSKLNGVDFGVPQNRERVFCLSVRKDVHPECLYFPFVSSTLECPKVGHFVDFVDKSVLSYNGPLMIDPRISNYLLPAYSRDLESISMSNKSIFTCSCSSGFQDHRVGISCCPTIRHQNQHTAIFINNQIHKLTACECWKFMGIKESDFLRVKSQSTISDNILCGLAGNAIVVPVLMSIFNQIWRLEQTGEPYCYREVPFLTTYSTLT